MAIYHNTYECSTCDVSWEDQWSCACDDECPVCGKSIQVQDYKVILEPGDNPADFELDDVDEFGAFADVPAPAQVTIPLQPPFTPSCI